MIVCRQPGQANPAPRGGRAVVCLLLILGLQLAAASPMRAGGAEPGEAVVRPWSEEGTLMVDLEVVTLFTPEVRETLGSGFTSTVATRILLQEAESGKQVAESRFTREVRYDVWDETYLITTYSEQGGGSHLAGTLDEVEDYCRRISE